MSTAVRRFFSADEGIEARRDENALSWRWLGLVMLLLAALLVATAASHPAVSASTLEPPYDGWTD